MSEITREKSALFSSYEFGRQTFFAGHGERMLFSLNGIDNEDRIAIVRANVAPSTTLTAITSACRYK